MRYDGFISYSHKKDRGFAESLQRTLHTIAKPLFKPKVLNVFRDETNLSASPHLWGDIEKALSQSKHLIFLASPKAADSKWVKKEINYWLEHKSIDTLILAITNGQFKWNDEHNDFDWEHTTAIPVVLKGKFKGEPFIVDFRKPDESKSDKSKLFEKYAKIAAVLHEKEFDELFGEDIKVQRRNNRIKNGAIFLLALLTLLAIFFWNKSEKNRKAAEINEEKAKREAIISKSNELNARALVDKENDPTKSFALAKEAYSLNQDNKDILNTIYGIQYKDVFSYNDELYSTPFYNDLFKSDEYDVLTQYSKYSNHFIVYKDKSLLLYDYSQDLIDSVGYTNKIGDIIFLNKDIFYTYSDVGQIEKWTLGNNKLKMVHSYSSKIKSIAAIAISEKDETIVVSDERGNLVIYRNGKLDIQRKFSEGIYDIDISKSNQYILIVLGHSTKLLDFNSLEGINEYNIKTNDGGRGFNPYFKDATFIGDEYVIVGLSNGKIQLYDIKGNRILYQGAHTDFITDIKYSSSNMISTSRDRTIKVWEVSKDVGLNQYFIDELVTLSGHEDDITEIDFVVNSNQIISHSSDGNIKLWDLEKYRIPSIDLKDSISPSHIAVKDKEKIIVSTNYGLLLDCRLDGQRFMIQDTLYKYEDRVSFIKYIDEKKTLLSSSHDGSFLIHKLGSSLDNYLKAKIDFAISSMSCDTELQSIITASHDRYLRLWSVSDNSILIKDSLKINEEDIQHVTLSKDGTLVFVMINDNKPRLYDLLNGDFSSCDTLPEISSSVGNADISEDNNFIAFTTRTGFSLWKKNAKNIFEEEFSVLSNEDYFTRVIIESDTKKILASRSSGKVEIWDFDKNKIFDIYLYMDQFRDNRKHQHIQDAGFYNQGKSFYTLSKNKLRFWNITSDEAQ